MADIPAQERKLKLPAVERGGRHFTRYDPNIALDIVTRIADGELLSKITAKDADPLTISKQTFLRWVASVPELSKAYAGALQLSAHSFEEKAIDKAEQVAEKPGSPQNVSAASLLISQYRWSAARRNPTRYADKGNTQIVVPVTINSTLNLGTGQSTTEAEIPDIYTLKFEDKEKVEEGEFNEITVDQGANTTETPLRSSDENKPQLKKEDFRELLDVDTPVVGLSRQPLLRSDNKGGAPKGPRKRVLTPRIKK